MYMSSGVVFLLCQVNLINLDNLTVTYINQRLFFKSNDLCGKCVIFCANRMYCYAMVNAQKDCYKL